MFCVAFVVLLLIRTIKKRSKSYRSKIEKWMYLERAISEAINMPIYIFNFELVTIYWHCLDVKS